MTMHSYSKNNSDKSSHSSARPFFRKAQTSESDTGAFFDPSHSPDTAFLQAKCMDCQTEERLDRQINNNAVPEKETLEEESIQAKADKEITVATHEDSTDSSKFETNQNETTTQQSSIHTSQNTLQAQSQSSAAQAGSTQATHRTSSPVIQRKAEIDQDESLTEEEEEQSPVQAKLTIGHPNDHYEQEADSIADQIVQRKESGDISTAAVPSIQTKCAECKIAPPTTAELAEEKPETISPKRETDVGQKTNHAESLNAVQTGLNHSRGQGRPLPVETLRLMQEGFGENFGHVRIHTDDNAAQMNRQIRARAFTHKDQIYFNQGNFNPGSREGVRLLAHEMTHVVQQTGSRAIQPQIQRAAEAKLGNWAHFKIQNALRGKDKKLITEAPIPGGSRNNKKLNTVGFADFYKAEKNTVSGIVAHEPDESKVLEDAHKFYKYINISILSSASSRQPEWKQTKWQKIKPRSIVNYGPRIKNHKKDQWDFTPNFPSNFQVGELKPLFPTQFPTSMAYHGTGFLQVGNYRQGFMEFVSHVYNDNPKHQSSLPSSITGSALNIPDDKIPPEINYVHFEKERLKTGPEWIWKKSGSSKDRVWMYKLKDGVYVYFLIPHPYAPKEFPEKFDKQLRRIDPLLDRLRKKRPNMSGKLLAKREQNPPETISQTNSKVGAPTIQAKKTDWKKIGADWEKARKYWVKGKAGKAGKGKIDKPREFLKEQARGIERKGKTDEKLGKKSKSLKVSGALKTQIKRVKKIRFWSGFRGRILGALRFRFGKVFDKVEDLFNRMKKKFKKHHTNSSKLNKKSGIFSGWKKVATRTIIRISVEILKEMLVHAFKGFVSCINGIVDAILGKFTKAVDEAKEDMAKEVEPICCEIMVFKKNLDTTYKKHEKTIAGFTETVETIQKWREILDHVETAVRVGVQILSCGTPPGLGCLWGLVAQLGIGAGLSLLARTDYFKDEIARPAARQLMDTIVGDSLHNFLIDTLEETPLKPFLAEAATCKRRNSASWRSLTWGKSVSIGGNRHKLDPNDPVNKKAREEWEKEYQNQILKDLQDVFYKDGKKKVTREELEKLIKKIKASGKTPAEIKKLLAETPRNSRNGKLDIDKASEVVNKGKAPKPEPKDRGMDYEKAIKNNVLYEKSLKWKPHTFIKKAGIKADSREFTEAIFDMQKALGIKADGIAGPNSVVKFYQKNRLRKGRVYKKAYKKVQEKKNIRRAKRYYSQLIKDLESVNWDKILPGNYSIEVIKSRMLLYGRTENGARVGAHFDRKRVMYRNKGVWKIVRIWPFTNLDPISGPDYVGHMSTTIKSQHKKYGGALVGDYGKHSSLNLSASFIGLLY